MKETEHSENLGVIVEHNIKIDFRVIGLEAMDWIHPAQDRDNWRTLEHRDELSAFTKDGKCLD